MLLLIVTRRAQLYRTATLRHRRRVSKGKCNLPATSPTKTVSALKELGYMFGKKSQFRFAKATEAKNGTFNGVTNACPSDSSLSVAASASCVAALCGPGTGNVTLFPVDYTLYDSSAGTPCFSAHGSAVSDLAFDPFSPDLLATTSDDATVRLWNAPTAVEEGPVAVVSGLSGPAHSLAFHRAVAGLVAVGTKNSVDIVDMANGGAVLKSFGFSGFGKDVLSVNWSFDGSTVSAVGKDGRLHVLDPRTADEGMLADSPNSGLRAQRAVHVKRDSDLLIFGLDKSRASKMAHYDFRNLEQPIATKNTGLSTGIMQPLYDLDTDLLFITARGSTLMNMFDLSSLDKFQKEHSFPLPGGFLGGAFIPKQACSFEDCEVQRIFQMCEDKIAVLPVTVPRKIRGFHDELYPDTPSIEPELQSAAEYMESNGPVAPKLLSINHLRLLLDRKKEQEKTASNKQEKEQQQQQQQEQQDQQQEEEVDAAAKEAEEARAAIADATSGSADRERVLSALRRSLFEHMSASEPNSSDKYWTDVRIRTCVGLGKNLKCNEKFWALPWESIGGSAIAVQKVGDCQRMANSSPLVQGHASPVSSFDLSLLNPTLLASGSNEGVAKMFAIPEDGLSEHIRNAIAELQCSGRIGTIDFHPYVEDVLVTSSSAYAESFVRFWDINEEKDVVKFDGFEKPVVDTSFSQDARLAAIASKDGLARVLDVRSGEIVHEWAPANQNHRDFRMLFLGASGNVCTVGSGGSTRGFSIWDVRNLSGAAATEHIESSNATPIPHFDPDSRVLLVGNTGSRTVDVFQIGEGCSTVDERLPVQLHSSAIVGMAYMPKRCVDVNSVELLKGFTVSHERKTVLPVSWQVPRRRTEFFQDDVFPPTLSGAPLMSAAEFFSGENREPQYVSLQPDDMTKLSEAPVDTLTEREKRYLKVKQEAAAPKPQNHLGLETEEQVRNHFLAQLADSADMNRWDAQPVDDGDEWSD